MSIRDSQRNKVYTAEKLAFPTMFQEIFTMAEVVEFVNGVVTSPYWDIKGGYATIHIGDGRGRRRACYTPSKRMIKLPKFARNPWMILHELAHALTEAVYSRSDDVATHGKEFCNIYIELVANVLGMGSAGILEKHFKEHKVKY